MKNAYTMLSPGRSGDWGKCLLVDESLGSFIKGEIEIDDLPGDIIQDLRLKENKEGIISEDELDRIQEEVYDSESNDDGCYYYLSNILYDEVSKYMIEFRDIAQLSNYVRNNNIFIIDNISA